MSSSSKTASWNKFVRSTPPVNASVRRFPDTVTAPSNTVLTLISLSTVERRTLSDKSEYR